MKCLPVMIRTRSTYQQNKTRRKPEGNFSILFVFELAHDVWRCLFSFFLLSTLNNQENIKTPTWLCLLECDKTPPLLSQCQYRGFNCKKKQQIHWENQRSNIWWAFPLCTPLWQNAPQPNTCEVMKYFNSISFSRLSFVSIYLILFILWHWLCAFFAHNSSSSNGKRLHPKTNQSNHPEQTIFVEMQDSATFFRLYTPYMFIMCVRVWLAPHALRQPMFVLAISKIATTSSYILLPSLCVIIPAPLSFSLVSFPVFPFFCCCMDLMNFHSTTPHSVIKWLFVARW